MRECREGPRSWASSSARAGCAVLARAAPGGHTFEAIGMLVSPGCSTLGGMAITRRVFVSGAMAAPLATQMGSAGAAAAQLGDQVLTALDGLTELRLTDFALEQLATQGIQVQTVEPATPIMGTDCQRVEGLKLTPEYASGTVTATGQLGKGSGRVLGGVVLSNSKACMEIADIRGSASDGLVLAFLKVNEQWLGELPLYAADLGAVKLSLQPGTPGQPIVVKGSGIPVTPTQQGVDAFAKAFGTALFTPKDAVFTAAVQGNAWPLPSLPV